VVALRLSFPVEAVRERLILDAGARGFRVKVNDLSPSGLVGVRARGVTVTTSEGTRIPFEELSVGLRLWPTLMGRRAFSFDASVFDGRVVGFTEAGKTSEHHQARVTGIDLARAGVVRAATGLDLAGILSGNLDVTLDPKDPSKSTGSMDFQVKDGAILGGILSGNLDVTLDPKDPSKSTGSIDFQVTDGAIRGGKIQVPGMEGGLTVPPVKLGAIAARGAVKSGRADFGTLESKGDDVDIVAEQVFIQLQPRFEHSALTGKARVRPTEAFWRKDQVAPLKPLIDAGLASAKGKDGGFGFQIYGTVGKPQARPVAF
jgi:hypothetical protein